MQSPPPSTRAGGTEGKNWEAQDAVLQEKIKSLGAAGKQFRIDFRLGRYFWIDGDDTLAIANCKVIASYQAEHHSYLAGWANPSDSIEGSKPARIPGLPDRLDGASPEEAWDMVTKVAEKMPSIEYLQSAQSGHLVYFVGLSNIREPKAGEEFAGDSAKQARQFVLNKINHLLESLDNPELKPDQVRGLFADFANRADERAKLYQNQEMGSRLASAGQVLKRLGKELGTKKLLIFKAKALSPENKSKCASALRELRAEWE